MILSDQMFYWFPEKLYSAFVETNKTKFMFYKNKNNTVITLPPNNQNFYAQKDIPKILKLKEDGGLFDKIEGFEELYQTKTERRSQSISGEVHRLDGYYDTKFIHEVTYYLRDAVDFAVLIAKKKLVQSNSSTLIFTKERRWDSLPDFVRVRLWHGKLSVELDSATLGTNWSPGVGILRG